MPNIVVVVHDPFLSRRHVGTVYYLQDPIHVTHGGMHVRQLSPDLLHLHPHHRAYLTSPRNSMSPSWTRSHWPFTPAVAKRSVAQFIFPLFYRPDLIPATNGSADPHPVGGTSGCMDKSSGDNGEIVLPTVKGFPKSTCTLPISSSPFSTSVSRSLRNSSPRAGKPYLMVNGKVSAISSLHDAPLNRV